MCLGFPKSDPGPKHLMVNHEFAAPDAENSGDPSH
jgi:hypothetical protein